MSKTAETSAARVRRASQPVRKFGRGKDGAVIESLPFKPVSFTVRELRKVIRDVRGHGASAG